ncbi:MAG: N(4)-(beta-N-acetylglucosaminyl)-L-asparaginase [Candidatus Aminicenantes bacterium]|nr:N(4)-(beta-N-acetylglucosaminyl)-L-asparaginase [Candidatus Aminicenantes bacterium]
MSSKITRRRFIGRSFSLGAGAFLFRGFSLSAGPQKGMTPLVITSHTNQTGQAALEKGWSLLMEGKTALDAVEKAANVIELDPEGTGVGYGGLPNEEGIVQLDASIMDGRTYSAGSVACLENIKTPCSVARIIMEETDHVMMAGNDALKFAKKWGFKEENLLTEKARKIWLRWKTEISKSDDWGLPDHLRGLKKKKINNRMSEEIQYRTGTTNVLAVDKNGDIAGVTTTSGLSFKIPGRVGDSPIIGAGLYVDNEVGAAGATGRGEDVIKCCASFYIVMRMKEGRTPQQACEDAVALIAEKYKNINPKFMPGEKFIAVNKRGEVGCTSTRGRRPARLSLQTAEGYSVYEGTKGSSR